MKLLCICSSQFTCPNGSCISLDRLCDNVADCETYDGTTVDELFCSGCDSCKFSLMFFM